MYRKIQQMSSEKYDNGENYSWGYIEGFWTDGNDSQVPVAL